MVKRKGEVSNYVWLTNICWYDRIKYCKVSCLIVEENNGWKVRLAPLLFHELSMGLRRNMAKQDLLGNYPLAGTIYKRVRQAHIKKRII